MTDDAQPRSPRRAPEALRAVGGALLGLGILGALWAFGGWIIQRDPSLFIFRDFAPGPTLSRFWTMVQSGEAWRMAGPSLNRVGSGLGLAILIGVPVGIVMGRSRLFRDLANAPFQFLRMISPLSWMPIAVMAFSTWDGAIVFLITVATVWPVLFATAAGVRRIDPAWLKVARNLGARPLHLLTSVILPAIAQDVFTGIRLALGVAWVVLVPAEYLGVTSGLGYAINDARDTLDYARLGATVLVIGVIGYALDLLCLLAIRRLSWLREEAR
ncbi:MAG: ABC transporter permease [Rhodobacteraceae bacterium]|nr:MAG: ABC transporter permease [Paracoccaceae bacterium]